MQLPRAVACREAALESRELPVDPVEVHAIAASIAARRPDPDFATRKFVRDDLRDLTDAIVLGILTDVEDLAADRLVAAPAGSTESPHRCRPRARPDATDCRH